MSGIGPRTAPLLALTGPTEVARRRSPNSGIGCFCDETARSGPASTPRIRLPEPEPPDTVEYVTHRLRLAGADADLFTTDALSLLHEGSAGRLRDVDRIATAALKAAARGKHNRVDRAIVVNVVASHQR